MSSVVSLSSLYDAEWWLLIKQEPHDWMVLFGIIHEVTPKKPLRHPIILMVDLKNLMADLVQTHYFFILTWLISYKASILTIHYGAIYLRFLFKVFPLIQRSEPRWAWFGEFSGGLPFWAGAAHSDLPGGDRQPGTGWGQQISLVLDTLNGFVH